MRDGFELVKLCKELSIQQWEGRGLIVSIHRFAELNAITGDVGRYPNEDIALGIDYRHPNFDDVIEALISAGILVEHPKHRLVIRDWHLICSEGIRKRVQREKRQFASLKPSEQ